jgi:hypothetical protein
MKSGAYKLTNIAHMRAVGLLEEMEILSVARVVSDRTIPLYKSHLPSLPFSCIEKETISLPTVLIAMLRATLPGKEEDDRESSGGADTTLLLPAKLVMKIASPIDLTWYEHSFSYLFRAQV